LLLHCRSKKVSLQYINYQAIQSMSLQKYIFLISFLVFFSGFSVAQQLFSEKNYSHTTDSANVTGFSSKQILLTDSIINYGKIFLNSPYHHGGKGESSSFDCSGFTSFVYRNFGFKLGASSSDQAGQFDAVDRCELKRGDLVFFAGRRPGKRVGHVGIVVNADQEGKFNFIHASTQHGVIISNSDEPYYLRRYIKAGRVVFNNQQIAVAPADVNLQKNFSLQMADNSAYPVMGSTTQTKKFIPARYHRVKKGDNLADIALKYGLTLTELKKKNKIKGNKITPNQRLKVKDAETMLLVNAVQPPENSPVQQAENQLKPDTTKVEQKAVLAQTNTSHIVQKGETLFSISNLYNTSVEQLKKINNILSGIVRVGQKLIIISVEKVSPKPEIAKSESTPSKETEKKPELEGPSQISTNSVINKTTHIVVANETLFSIANIYNLSFNELKKINNLTSNKIKPGQKLKLVQNSIAETAPMKSAVSGSEKKKESVGNKLTHKVKSGETYYSIAREFGCKVEELKAWNKKSGNKIKSGQKLIIYQKAD